MQEMLKRNAPVFIIGTVTLLIFAGIIVASQAKPPVPPQLQQVDPKILITDTTNTLGPEDAKVTIVEFSDFQCPGCAAFFPILKDLYQNNQDTVRIGYRHLPLLSVHPNAKRAAEASEIAAANGKFWEYAQLLFDNQNNLSRERLIELAVQVGLDKDNFISELDRGAYTALVNADLQLAEELGVNSTPTVFVNGEKLYYNTFGELIDQLQALIQIAKESSETPTP